MIRRKNLRVLDRIDRISHPLLDVARASVYAGHRCQHHASGTAAAGQKVFEVEDAASGWRGAVILDEAGDPWLVYVESHDRFHNRAKHILARSRRDDWYPNQTDYALRDADEHAAAGDRWRHEIASIFLNLVDEALQTARDASAPLPGLPMSATPTDGHLTVALDHDPVSANVNAGTAHTSQSMATVTVRVVGYPDRLYLQMLIGVLAPMLLGSEPIPGYLPRRRGLVYIVTLSKADLIQLIDLQRALSDSDRWFERAPVKVVTSRHYVRDKLMADALISGNPVRAVCGVWFVPTRDAAQSENLPLCTECDTARPLAQVVLDLIRSGRR